MNQLYKENVSADDYIALRNAVGWEDLCHEQARRGLENSAYTVGCYIDDGIAGCARVIWDKGYIAYLADVMVMPEYQGRGIGTAMVERALAFVRAQMKPGWKIKIVLAAAKGKEPFYARFGFQTRPGDCFGAGMDMWLRG